MTAAPKTRRTEGSARIYLLWALLALPGVALVVHDFLVPVRKPYLYWSGLMSCWLLAVTLAVTPLALLFGPRPWVRWFRTNRRYLGVASFGYALLHIAFWLKAVSLGGLLRSFVRIEILTGWIALAILLALAVTSTDRAVDRMGQGWKRLQRWVYPAAILTLMHWVLTGHSQWDVLACAVPLGALVAWRLMRQRGREELTTP
jgi:sulfoxide reductase heme-binding subunit YedZ